MRTPLLLLGLLAACATSNPPPPAEPTRPTVSSGDHPMEPDACLAAVCPPDTRCEPTRGPSYQQGTAHDVMRPRCVRLTATPAPPLSRDPCGSWICPSGYHCTAPADAPYCERM